MLWPGNEGGPGSEVPDDVAGAIRDHLRSSVPDAADVWESAGEEEDTITGEVGGSLKKGWQPHGDWKWRVTYKKFRGRGPGAEEKPLGADGIFQVHVEANGVVSTKALLFQGKKRGEGGKKLRAQCERMERHLPGGSAVWEYGPDGFYGLDASQVLREARVSRGTESLGDYLADRFLGCQVGRHGVYFDAYKKALVVPPIAVLKFDPSHRVSVDVIRGAGNRTRRTPKKA